MGFCGLMGLLCLVIGLMVFVVNGQPLVPSLFIFGDSVVDVGNNNDLLTIVKSNFPPYGRDFVTHQPTGRFCNGKLATDFTATNLGFTSFPPAYSTIQRDWKNLLNGSNFASAASGYYDATAKLYHAIPLTQQVENFKEYKNKLMEINGTANVSAIISKSIYLVSSGSSDFVQNYYINPLLRTLYTPDQFSDKLINSYTTFIQNLYGLGARRIGVTSLPPVGCLPASRTLFGLFNKGCVENQNNDAISFNNKLNATSINLQKQLPDLKLVVFDIYTPLLDLVTKPAEHGFAEARKACCGSGLLETSILCNQFSIGTCANASQYVFWDGFHPTEAANKILADTLLLSEFLLFLNFIIFNHVFDSK